MKETNSLQYLGNAIRIRDYLCQLRCYCLAKIADDNTIYGYHMNGSRGDDKFKDYDSYVKFIKANGDYAKAQYGYDYKGKKVKVYCSVAFGDFGLNVTLE